MDRRAVCYRLHGDGGPRCYLKPEKRKKKKALSFVKMSIFL